jgi:arylsulfatase A-like enzyme
MSRLLLASIVGLLTAACSREEPRERWNVLVITVDTLRADHLSCYGYGQPTTPRLDAFAGGALRFENASTPRAKTTPALASLFTGLHPHEHGVRDLVEPLADDVPTLAESLSRAGWRTGAVVGNWVLANERSGLARGFGTWVERLPDTQGVPPDDVPQRTARSLTDAGLALLGLGPADPTDAIREPVARADGTPWFVWLHYMDPHGTYEPPTEHRVFHSAREPIGPPREDAAHTRRIADYNVPPNAIDAAGVIDAAAVRDLYDGEIRYVDAEIGRLLDALAASGGLERTLVVITADHGESLGEHDYWFEHGLYAYQNTCRVPLIVRLPDGFPSRPAPGARRGVVSLVDLAPTVCDVLGLEPLATSDSVSPRGVSRAALFTADDPRERAVFFEKVERADLDRTVQTKGVRIGRWKLLRRYTHRAKDGTRELVKLSDELYDLDVDPLEARDLAATPGDAPLERLNAALERFTAADVHFAELGDTLLLRREELERTDPEQARRLRALGY